jgi:hypothetical protein
MNKVQENLNVHSSFFDHFHYERSRMKALQVSCKEKKEQVEPTENGD